MKPAVSRLLRWVSAPLLLPLSWLFGGVVILRGWLYDRGWMRSYSSPIPTVGIGNLTVGGTGKSPMADLLLRMLREEMTPALLSRGYGRSTRGYLEVTITSGADQVGDEPFMLKRAHPWCPVAVCEDRVAGCHELVRRHPQIGVVLLDDAYQHRRLRLDFSILLTDYHRLHCDDGFLPYGRRRDALGQARRANVIVVTKCPPALADRPDELQRLAQRLAQPGQPVLFSTVEYEVPYPLLPHEAPTTWNPAGGLWLLAGIAQPAPFLQAAGQLGHVVGITQLRDHERLSPARMEQLAQVASQGVTLLMTAKDAARILHLVPPGSPIATQAWILPISTRFLGDGYERLRHLLTQALQKKLSPPQNMTPTFRV